MDQHKPWRGRTGGGKLGQQFLFFVLRYVKVTALYPVLYLVIPLCLLFVRKPNHALFHYFYRIRKFGWWQSLWATCRTAHTFGKVVIDKFAILAGRADQFLIEVPQQAIFDRLLMQDGGFILAGSHIGNVEMMGQCLSQDRKSLYGIIFDGESETFEQRREQAFARQQVKLIPIKPDMSHLFLIKEALDKGDIITIFCDRIFGSDKTLTANFFGRPAHFPLGPFKLAAQMNVPMLAVFLMKVRGVRYRGFVIPMQTDDNEPSVARRAQQLLQQYVTALEEMLTKYPYQWFNLYEFWEQ